jgi:hypothetical protein
MRLPLLTIAALFISVPAFAGNLSFDGGQTTWHSTQCNKPVPPSSFVGADPETHGEDMNALVSQHNAYIDAAQGYMNCISNEADRDQTMVNQAIASGARRVIADEQAEINQASTPLRRR